MADGLAGSNKVGIKGEEDIGNMKVGFKLENGFHVANGAMKASGTLFDREARMYVKGAFGEVAAGRFGGLASAAGTYDLFFGQADAFDGGDNDVPFAFAKSDRYNNSLAYQTPEFAGVQGTLMYSFNKKDAQENKFKDNDRYLGAGLTFKQDKLSLVGVVEAQLRPSATKDSQYKNGFTYSFGGNYDFGVAKLFAGAQVARNTIYTDINTGMKMDDVLKGLYTTYVKPNSQKVQTQIQGLSGDQAKVVQNAVNQIVDVYNNQFPDKKIDALTDIKQFTLSKYEPAITKFGADMANHIQYNGYAFTLGTQIPVGANNFTLGTYYGNYKNAFKTPAFAKKAVKLQVYGLAGRYEYSLSNRTSLYAGAGIGQSKLKFSGYALKNKIAQVYAGLHHSF